MSINPIDSLLWQYHHEPLAWVWEKEYSGDISSETQFWLVDISHDILFFLESLDLLDRQERIKAGKYFQEADQYRYITGKVLGKLVLSRLLSISPEEITFEKARNGKPYLRGFPNIHFNLSHSGDKVALLVSNSPCGIDVEEDKPGLDYLPLMRYAFHSREIEWVNVSSEPRLAFYKIWTAKEALLKAHGSGLIDDLPSINCLMRNQVLPTSEKGSDLISLFNLPVLDRHVFSLAISNPMNSIKFFRFRDFRHLFPEK